MEPHEHVLSAEGLLKTPLSVLEREADSLLGEVSREVEQKAQAHESMLELKGAPSAEDCHRSNEDAAYPRRVSPFLYVAVAVFLGLATVEAWFNAFGPRASGPYHDVEGAVESSAVVMTGRGGYAAMALVRTPSGALVQLRLRSASPLEPGSHIRLRAYDTGAYAVEPP